MSALKVETEVATRLLVDERGKNEVENILDFDTGAVADASATVSGSSIAKLLPYCVTAMML